jgi:hypothetical protein
MQYNFDIKIPEFLLVKEEDKHEKINFDLLDGKVLIGLAGYAKSGKDTIATKFIKDFGFHRIAFADNIKVEMNKYMKELVYEDLNFLTSSDESSYIPIEKIDFTTEDLEIKKVLRPYIIWYGEKLRDLNGAYYWINRAFSEDAKGYDNLVISDVRRPKELEIFEDSNSFRKRSERSFALASYYDENIVNASKKIKPYSSLLFYVNQYGLKDDDILTKETILTAQENWIFDDTFYVDSRLPNKEMPRNYSINVQIRKISEKFGIKKPNNQISKKQLKMF